ncbi:GntR family transcriptional regulator [Streptomyces sp. NPDC006552]|uniref:winged helix-turn-helix domain-containing protein n=1 Tax=Streptomyces sp. NPDC006552 TaxID=3157179 RepID=UPI0033AD5279
MSGEPAAANGGARPPREQWTYREVADELRARIRAGRLRPGQRMPTQAQLADDFGVERSAVRQALRVLQAEQLLANVSKGSPATVAEPTAAQLDGPAASPQPTMVTLSQKVAAAFRRQDVEIDALCLTSVSLTLAMGEPLRHIHAGRIKPARVRVRVLLPSRDIDLAFPAPADAAVGADGVTGDRLQHYWLQQRNAQGQVLRHNLLALRTTHGIDVQVAFRALPFTPPVKLYLLNNAEALFAYYTLTRRGELVGQERVDVYDAQGVRQMLFAFRQGAGSRDTTFVEQSHLWFDSLWNTISTELSFGS